MKSLDTLVRTDADLAAEQLFEQFQKVQEQYAVAIRSLLETDYQTHWDKMPDIRRVSLLGLANVDLGKAYSAMNAARCN